MKFYFLLALIFCLNYSYCQEFSFEMYFEDASGSKDTLIFGYDINGTDTIDNLFNEVNIMSLPWDTSKLDVRITDEWLNRWIDYSPGTFQTKKTDYSKKLPQQF